MEKLPARGGGKARPRRAASSCPRARGAHARAGRGGRAPAACGACVCQRRRPRGRARAPPRAAPALGGVDQCVRPVQTGAGDQGGGQSGGVQEWGKEQEQALGRGGRGRRGQSLGAGPEVIIAVTEGGGAAGAGGRGARRRRGRQQGSGRQQGHACARRTGRRQRGQRQARRGGRASAVGGAYAKGCRAERAGPPVQKESKEGIQAQGVCTTSEVARRPRRGRGPRHRRRRARLGRGGRARRRARPRRWVSGFRADTLVRAQAEAGWGAWARRAGGGEAGGCGIRGLSAAEGGWGPGRFRSRRGARAGRAWAGWRAGTRIGESAVAQQRVQGAAREAPVRRVGGLPGRSVWGFADARPGRCGRAVLQPPLPARAAARSSSARPLAVPRTAAGAGLGERRGRRGGGGADAGQGSPGLLRGGGGGGGGGRGAGGRAV
jgi:hypothetical protein